MVSKNHKADEPAVIFLTQLSEVGMRPIQRDCIASSAAEDGARRWPSLTMAEHGDAKLTDLLVTLADCSKARWFSVYDRCKAVYEGL